MQPSEPDAELLKQNWELRARSADRDFYVASHAGWNDPARWEQQALADLQTFLWQLDPDALRAQQVLEIGCGVGRLALPLAARVASYTGIDIAPAMVAEARHRARGIANVRFFESDGTGVPTPARDRSYDLILAVAVLIHCPERIVRALVQGAWSLLAPGGQFRFQVLADPADPTMVGPPQTQQAVVAEILEMEQQATPAQLALIEGHYYMGHRFRYDECVQSMRAWTGGEVVAFRLSPAHIYGYIRKP
jgi:SAM-dependent methyltransferase